MELFEFDHVPAVPPRDGIIGEQVFAKAWQRLMTHPPMLFDGGGMLHSILYNYIKTVGQREATVCASVVCWLGTNCGRSFLDLCKRLDSDKFSLSSGASYLAAWSMVNKRRSGQNNGIRTLEHCLSIDALLPCASGVGTYRPAAELTADDYECAECLIYWLGSADGKRFITYCEMETDLQLKKPKFPFPEDKA